MNDIHDGILHIVRFISIGHYIVGDRHHVDRGADEAIALAGVVVLAVAAVAVVNRSAHRAPWILVMMLLRWRKGRHDRRLVKVLLRMWMWRSDFTLIMRTLLLLLLLVLRLYIKIGILHHAELKLPRLRSPPTLSAAGVFLGVGLLLLLLLLLWLLLVLRRL